MKLIIFVHTCTKYEETRAKIIENTWAANREEVIFITDNPNCKLKNHIYVGPYKPGPTYHPETLYKMFILFMKKYDTFDYFMIIDDDTYLYINKLKHFLSFFDATDTYMIGDFLNWIGVSNNPKITCDYNIWVSGGPGIVFTKNCIQVFLHLMMTRNISNVNHDVLLHLLYVASSKRIKRVDCPGFHQYGAESLYKKYDKNNNHLISIHLERNMGLIHYYHDSIGNEDYLHADGISVKK